MIGYQSAYDSSVDLDGTSQDKDSLRMEPPTFPYGYGYTTRALVSIYILSLFSYLLYLVSLILNYILPYGGACAVNGSPVHLMK